MGYAYDRRKNNRRSSSPSIQTDSAQKTQLPNSLVNRIMEDQAAESEADRLSQGVTSTTPEAVMREMSSRLGADFSNVQFHSDSLSMNQSRAMGARAWAQGRDVHFGKGGFDPKVAAHELVHTVQQGAVEGDVSESVPMNTVQLFRDEDENAIQRRQSLSANASNLQLMTEQKNSTRYGQEVFSDLKKPIKTLAEKSGSRINAVNEDAGILFMSNLGERDYSGKEILKDIATRSVINKDEMYDRTDEYESFLDYMQNRTDKVGLEVAAYQSQILRDAPKFDQNAVQNFTKRAYEMTAQELANDTINPTNDAEVGEALKKIDNAQDAKAAFFAFLGYTQNREYTARDMNDPRLNLAFINTAQVPTAYGKNDKGKEVKLSETEVEQREQLLAPIEARITDATSRMEINKQYLNYPKNHKKGRKFKAEYDKAKADLDAANKQKEQTEVRYSYKMGADINVPLFKAKLKNMVRQVRDYPELKHKYNGINVQWNQKNGNLRDQSNEDVMAVSPSPGGRETATIHYDAYVDRDTPEAQQARTQVNASLSRSVGHLDKVGNHEQGHILESTLNPTEEDQARGTASNDILQSVLPKVLNQQDLQQVNYAQQNGKNAKGYNIYQGQVDTSSNVFETNKLTSSYGQSNSKEWFAEAFHDVYTKGADAKQTSIEIVKEYEKRSTAKQKGEFRKKERGIFTRIKRWFSKKFNYGARHGDPQPQAAPAPQQAAADPLALPQVIDNQNDNPQPEANLFQHYADNMLNDPMTGGAIENQIPQPKADPFQHYADNMLDLSMIVENPKQVKNGRKIPKKRKKK